jgi:hypothetical protein
MLDAVGLYVVAVDAFEEPVLLNAVEIVDRLEQLGLQDILKELFLVLLTAIPAFK